MRPHFYIFNLRSHNKTIITQMYYVEYDTSFKYIIDIDW